MRSRLRAVAKFVLLAVIILGLLPRAALAAERDDTAAIAAVDKVLTNDVAQANFGEAKRKLKTVLDRCRKACSPPALARVHLALGIVAAQIGQTEDAKTAWSEAFTADPNVQLPSGTTSGVRQQFEQAQKAWLAANPQPDDAQKAGWLNKQAFELAKAGAAAETAGNWLECIDKEKAALTLEENIRARLSLAHCEAKAGKLIDALRSNAKALDAARARNDATTAKVVQERVTELIPRLGHVKFEIPAGVTDLKINFDDRTVPVERYRESFTIDPGAHSVHAEGSVRGVRMAYDEKVQVGDGETATVKITLKPAAVTQGQLECIVAAKTQEELLECIPQERKPLSVHSALDVSGYTDTTDVHVITPSVRASVASPTAGWNVGGSYLVDVVTAASPDVVSTASRRFQDVRHAGSVNGGYKPGRFGGQVWGNYSVEHDYVSRTVGASVSGDFADKQVTPQLGFSHTWDTVGRTGTDFDVFSHSFTTEEISAGATVIASPVSLFVFGATVGLENGDQSKPYRYIPMFEPGVSVPIGASADLVNAARLPIKPIEQLPLDRQRLALAGRYVYRMRSNATLRLEERIYTDTWGIKGTTTDARYLVDTSPRLRLWPHLHLHGQTGASFYSRIYGATLNSDGSALVPKYRSSDRELSPMLGITLGGGARFALTDPQSKFQFAIFSTVDALYNRYINTLYITDRLAVYGTLGIEADFE